MAGRRIKLWFPGRDACPLAYTEAHRKPHEAEALAVELGKLGIDCTPDLEPDCDACLCGTIWLLDAAEKAMKAGVPLIHYCWDLYPWQLKGGYPGAWKPNLWKPYLEQLKRCHDVWAPSRCTADRVLEFAGRSAHVILTAVHPWDAPTHDGGYVVDVMRPYVCDPMNGVVGRACRELGIPCIESAVTLPWEEFKRAVAGARLLVSAYEEASTGGLTLLEGYYLGKPVLLSDSPRMGARDYFGEKRPGVGYFKWDSPAHLKVMIDVMRGFRPGWSEEVGREWITATYSDAAMARRMATRLREMLC